MDKKMDKVSSFNPVKFMSDNAIVLLVLILAIVTGLTSKNFFTVRNFSNLVINMSPRFIIACGVSGCLITKGTDLSAGRQVGLSACLAAMMLQDIDYTARMLPWFPDIPWWLALIFVMIIMGIIGGINGCVIAFLKVPPFIATLGTMSLYRGIAYVVTGGVPVTNVPSSFRNIFNGQFPGGIRYYVVVMVAVFIIAHIILSKTRTGDYLYSVGGNEEAAKLSGVNTRKTKYIAYIASGVCTAVAGMVMLASLGSAEATAGTGYETDAIAAAAIGGTSMAGGRGTAFGTFCGAFLLAILKVGMVVISVDSFWQYVVTGLIIVVASYFEFAKDDFAAFMARFKRS